MSELFLMRHAFSVEEFRGRSELTTEEQIAFTKEVAQSFQQDMFRPEYFRSDPYSQIEIAADRRRLEDRQRSFDNREGAGEAALFEYALMAGIKLHGWFGDEVESVRKASEFDDVFHGVDFVITFLDEQDQPIHIAVDTTTNTELASLQRKIGYTVDGLKRKKLTQVKYFEDITGERGAVQIPRIVLGTERAAAIDLQRTFIEQPGRLERHPIQMEYLIEAREQLCDWLAVLFEEHHIIDKEAYTIDPDILLGYVSAYAARLQKDPELYRAIMVHAHALAAILRALESKKSLGTRVAPERQEAEPLRFLTDPLHHREERHLPDRRD